MKKFMSAVRKELTSAFNGEVADRYRAAGVGRVIENCKQIAGLRLERSRGQDIGAIDVLVIDDRSRVLLAIEVKDFARARTAAELSTEVDKLFGESDSAVSHPLERVSFLRQRLPEVLKGLGVSGARTDWQVRGLVVTSHDLVASGFKGRQAVKRSRLKVVSYEDLVRTPDDELITRSKPCLFYTPDAADEPPRLYSLALPSIFLSTTLEHIYT